MEKYRPSANKSRHFHEGASGGTRRRHRDHHRGRDAVVSHEHLEHAREHTAEVASHRKYNKATPMGPDAYVQNWLGQTAEARTSMFSDGKRDADGKTTPYRDTRSCP